ncbi:MAG: EamA family transporter [Ignisphaera sp.]
MRSLDEILQKLFFILAIVTSVLGWGIGMYLFIYLISTIGISITAIASALTPVLVHIITKLFAKEQLTKNNIIGALMISVGIVISAVRL